MQEEGAFDADAVGTNAANGEVFFDAAAAFAHDDALKDLDAFAVAFDDADMDADAVPGFECRDALFEILIDNCFDEVHGYFLSDRTGPYLVGLGRCPTARVFGTKKSPRITRADEAGI